MSLASPHCTSLMIIMEKANIEYRLMQITQTLESIARSNAAESTALYQDFTNSLAMSVGEDDEAKVALDAFASTNFNMLQNNLRLKYKVKEDMLNNQKLQLESRHKALCTQEDWVNKMVDSGVKDLKYFQ